MDEKLQKLYCECINELESIGLKIKEDAKDMGVVNKKSLMKIRKL